VATQIAQRVGSLGIIPREHLFDPSLAELRRRRHLHQRERRSPGRRVERQRIPLISSDFFDFQKQLLKICDLSAT
jgi:hypothetical protein